MDIKAYAEYVIRSINKMDTDKFTKILEKNQFGPYVGIPCSTFKYLLNYIIEKKIEYYPCTSEG